MSPWLWDLLAMVANESRPGAHPSDSGRARAQEPSHPTSSGRRGVWRSFVRSHPGRRPAHSKQCGLTSRLLLPRLRVDCWNKSATATSRFSCSSTNWRFSRPAKVKYASIVTSRSSSHCQAPGRSSSPRCSPRPLSLLPTETITCSEPGAASRLSPRRPGNARKIARSWSCATDATFGCAKPFSTGREAPYSTTNAPGCTTRPCASAVTNMAAPSGASPIGSCASWSRMLRDCSLYAAGRRSSHALVVPSMKPRKRALLTGGESSPACRRARANRERSSLLASRVPAGCLPSPAGRRERVRVRVRGS